LSLGNSSLQILQLQSLCIRLRENGFTQGTLFCANIKFLLYLLLLKCFNTTIFVPPKKETICHFQIYLIADLKNETMIIS